MRQFVSIILMIAMLVTSHSAALARSDASHAVGTMVICAGNTTQLIYVDRDGQPLDAQHACPECCLHFLAGNRTPGSVQPASFSDVGLHLLGGQTWCALQSSGTFRARAPPLNA